MHSPFNWCIFNRQLLSTDKASVSLSDMGLLRGYAVFDFFKVMQGIPMHLAAHLSRLQYSIQQLQLQLPFQYEDLQQQVYELVSANELQTGCIRILVTGGDSVDGYNPTVANCYITAHPMPARNEEQYQKGIHALTYNHHREMPDVKTTNYLQGVRLHPRLKTQGADDVIYCFENLVLETPRSNVFAIDTAGNLRTPDTGMLKGITRNNVLQLATAIMPVVEGPLSSAELRTASEVFITSTTKGILPVGSINHQKVGNGQPGPFTKKLQELLTAFENEILKR